VLGIPDGGDFPGYVTLPALGAEFTLHWRGAREAAGRDRLAAEVLGHGVQDATVAEAVDESGKTIKFDTLALSKNLNFDAIL
jgi:hypothetical protein